MVSELQGVGTAVGQRGERCEQSQEARGGCSGDREPPSLPSVAGQAVWLLFSSDDAQ